MQFLSNFRLTSWIQMKKTLNKVLLRCPVRFSKEIKAVFQMKILRNLHRKRQNFESFSIFKLFYAFLNENLTDSVDWNLLKGQQEKGWLSSGLEEIIAMF